MPSTAETPADITSKAIELFVTLGSFESLDSTDALRALGEIRSRGRSLRHDLLNHPTIQNLDCGELVALFKGVVRAETFYGRSAGSGAISISIYRLIEEKCEESTHRAVAGWALIHSDNSYVPFGGARYSSYGDYKWQNSPEGIKAYQLYSDYRKRKEEEERAAAQERREARWRVYEARRRVYEENRKRAEERRRKDLSEICHLSAIDGLKHMLEDKDSDGSYRFSIAHYPIEWTDAREDELHKFSKDELLEINRRAQQPPRTNKWLALGARVRRVMEQQQ